MTDLTRRDVLAAGLAVPAASLLDNVTVQARRAPGQIVIEAVEEGTAQNLSPTRISIEARPPPYVRP